MKFLIDTNIFKHTINDNIYAVACKCKEKDSPMYITTTILNELEPGPNVADSERQVSQEVYNRVNSCTCDPFNWYLCIRY